MLIVKHVALIELRNFVIEVLMSPFVSVLRLMALVRRVPILAHRWRIYQERVRLLRPYNSVLLPTELPMAIDTKMLLTVLLKVGIFERNREQVSVVWLAHLPVTI